MTFLKNLGLFFVVFLPVIAITGMIAEGIAGPASPTWRVGWNPLLWLVWTAPWHAPVVVAVPLLHILGRRLARRGSRSAARRTLLVASPLTCAVVMLGVYGPDNAGAGTLLPILLAGLAYGAVLRIPEVKGVAAV
jgi:hypothetical protein